MQNLRRFFRRNDLYFLYMAPMILIFILILIYLFVNFNLQTRIMVEQDVQSVTISRVEGLRTRMDTVLEDVKSSLTQLGTSSDTLALLKTMEEKGETGELLPRVQDRLLEEKNFTQGVENYGIYHHKSQMVILPDGTMSAREYAQDVIDSDDKELFSRQMNEVKELTLWVVRDRDDRIESIMAFQSYPASRHTKTASGFSVLVIQSIVTLPSPSTSPIP